jgi:hypothetical protein
VKSFALLPDETELVIVAGELVRLDEHAAGAAAGVEDHAALGFEHRHQGADDGERREVLAAALAFGGGELADEVFVDAADQVRAVVILLEDILGE